MPFESPMVEEHFFLAQEWQPQQYNYMPHLWKVTMKNWEIQENSTILNSWDTKARNIGLFHRKSVHKDTYFAPFHVHLK